MSLSRLDIEKYKSTKNHIEKNALEISVCDDSFQNDALEGWANPLLTTDRLKHLDRKFKKPKRIAASKYLYLFITSMTIVALGLLFVLQGKSSVQKDDKKSTSKIIINKKKFIQAKANAKIGVNHKRDLNPKKVKRDFQTKTIFDSTDYKNSVLNNNELTKLPINKTYKIEVKRNTRSNIGIETYIQNLKVIDYRNYRSRQANKLTLPMSGTSAENEIKLTQSKEDKLIIEQSYVSHLEKCLELFNLSMYKKAILHFDQILDTYPKDVNALFYSALCYYKIEEYENCEIQLIKLQNSEFTNFDQEQQWYLLLTFKELHRKESFEKLKESIIQENGFYSKRAIQLSL